jgi:hypothetical protein
LNANDSTLLSDSVFNASRARVQKPIDSLGIVKVNKADSSINGGYYPYATNPKNYLTSIPNSLHKVYAGYGLLNANDSTLLSDSVFNASRARVQKPIDSLGIVKLNVSDTSSMLTNYRNNISALINDSSYQAAQILLRVKYTDTSSMLSPYQRSTFAVKYSDTANIVSGYQRKLTLTTTGSSGAATLDAYGNINIPQYSTSLSGYVQFSDTTYKIASRALPYKINDSMKIVNAATYVPQTRTLTINGTALDLSANRSWSVGTVTSIATTNGILGGTITSTGTLQVDTGRNNLKIPTGNDLNQVKDSLLAVATHGTVTSVAMSVPSFLSISGSPITSSGTLAVTLSGTALPIANGGTGTTTGTTINGQAITYGTTNTITAAAGTLTGTTLNSTVVSSSLTSVGTIGTGVWQGTAIADSYISSASTWNGKQSAYTNLTSIGSLTNGTGWLYNNGTGTFSYTSPTKTTVGLGNVENTALSTWAGSGNITTVGTITTGVWNATAIADTYIASASTWNGKQAALSGTGFVKISGTTISYDNSTYLIGNQTITLSGDVAGSGTTAITTTLATVNTNTGSWGSASSVATFTVNGKGLITASSNTSIQISESQVTSLTTDLGNKQATLSGTGIVKSVSGTISYLTDNSGNWNTAFGWGNWASNFGTGSGTIAQGNDSRINNGQTAYSWGNPSGVYLPLTGGTLTGALSGTSASFSGNILLSYSSSTTLGNAYPRMGIVNSNASETDFNVAELYVGAGNGTVQGGIAASYSNTFPSGNPQALILRTTTNSPLLIQTNNTTALTINSSQAATFSSSVTASSLSISGAGSFGGYLTASGGAGTSDIRLKTNIVYNPSISILDSIDFIQYNMKDNLSRLRYGNIAQNIERINPDLVLTNDKGIKAIMYDDLQNIEIHELYLRVKKLEKELSELKSIQK